MSAHMLNHCTPAGTSRSVRASPGGRSSARAHHQLGANRQFRHSALTVQRATRSATPQPLTMAAVQVDLGSHTELGTVRKQNEDRCAYYVDEGSTPKAGGEPFAYFAVFDGHGGFATSEWLTENLLDCILRQWQTKKSYTPEISIRKAFIEADNGLLAPKGFMGMGERGTGGSKCGSTAAVLLAYKPAEGGTELLAANCGDARVIVCKDGEPPVQLTVDHVPDNEQERARIEKQNPNKKKPLVKYVGGTWRVGGLLALSRAFGDAYLKASGLNEGLALDSDYSSGFGVIPDPHTATMALEPKDKGWVIVCSDGLNTNEERGGGGGLDNEEIARVVKGWRKSPDELAEKLVLMAQDAGSTDDTTVLCIPLQDLYA